MPPIAEEIYQIILLAGRSMTINEIVKTWNIFHPTLLANYKKIYNSIYREWKRDNYVFYNDNQFGDYRIGIEEVYYRPNGRVAGP